MSAENRISRILNGANSFESGKKALIAFAGTAADGAYAYANSPSSPELWWFKLANAVIFCAPVASVFLYQIARVSIQSKLEYESEMRVITNQESLGRRQNDIPRLFGS